MCTVSIVPLPDGCRLVVNRDESRRRGIALPPAIVARQGVRAVMPRDPDSGGTWVAANEFGLVFALLNVSEDGVQSARTRSRGEIIPSLIDLSTADAVVKSIPLIDDGMFRPWRLVVADRDAVLELRTGGASRRHALDRPLMFTSSGLGDHLVEGPRRALFDAVMSTAVDAVGAQDLFHVHRWPSRLHLSVEMERADARTVSRTAIEVREGGIEMIYTALAEDGAMAPSVVRLGR
ncbi:MAG TPA: NRDE family protein [Vicinamibacterales bacterium]|nr:NRDE family protein [Vicinamibacterales bacterium]